LTTQEACKRFGIEYQTAKNASCVCKSFNQSIRQRTLSFEHHKEVAGRDDKVELLAVTMTTECKAGEMLAAMETIAEEGNRKKSEAAKAGRVGRAEKKAAVDLVADLALEVDHRDPPVNTAKKHVAREARAAEAKVTP
jgi:hypothetical protein